ncbi:MAG TPA: hypothetical protein VHO25_05700 [Polyangiaceae bacterium]|nr:hypothetical protein [Polyangiaceae bacterium]
MRLPILFFALALGCGSEATSPRQMATQPTTTGSGNGGNGTGGDEATTTNTSHTAGMAGAGGAIVAVDGTVAGQGGMLSNAGSAGEGGAAGAPFVPTCPLGTNPVAPVPCRADEEGQGCSYAVLCGPTCSGPCAPRLLPDAPEPHPLESWMCQEGFWVSNSYPCPSPLHYTCECEADASAPAQDADSSDAG